MKKAPIETVIVDTGFRTRTETLQAGFGPPSQKWPFERRETPQAISLLARALVVASGHTDRRIGRDTGARSSGREGAR